MNHPRRERYPVKPNRYSSHSQILDLLGSGNGRSLLDVGCARGHLSQILQKQNWNVIGIEADESEAALASASGVEVRIGTAEAVVPTLKDEFDVIVFADVLEHMVNPLEVLTLARGRLSTSGKIIISIPNIAHLSVRLQLLFGSFNYTERGILDRTHLRFFTNKTLLELVHEAGLRVCHVGVTPAPVEEAFPRLGRYGFFEPVLILNAWLARLWRAGLAYQYIVVAELTPELVGERPGG